MIRFAILTLFPDMFRSPLASSLLKRAIDKGIISVSIFNIRDFTRDKHHVVDDSPYGGGSGMVMKAGPIVEGIERIKSADGSPRVILMTPQGVRFDHSQARRLSHYDHLLFVCGRYEGVDERVREYIDEEVSIGDYILTPSPGVCLECWARRHPLRKSPLSIPCWSIPNILALVFSGERWSQRSWYREIIGKLSVGEKGRH